MMATWVLVPCLVRLRAELDQIAPGRDRTSDGTIGDAAHQSSVSDHNDDEVGRVPIRDADSKHEVHAYDADADLRTPNLTMEMVVQHILGRCRSGAEDRLRYIIFNRRIWEASNDWRQRAYTGSSPHTEHAHFSASYVTAREADTGSWGLEDLIEGDDMLVRKGDGPSEEVKFWQFVLEELGHDVGAIDGEYGPKMEGAVNRDRAARGSGPTTQITGWHGMVLLKSMMAKYAGKPGKDGTNGRDGKDGADGVLSGALTVTGGRLTVEAETA